MSSIRLFILGTLAQHGAMHGYQLRFLAEEEHVHLWTDVSVGALYGAMSRLAKDGLITQVRVEHEGNYPQRQVYEISDLGRRSLATLRSTALRELVLRPDPFDLALTRLDHERLDELGAVLEMRLSTLRARVQEGESRLAAVREHLTVAEAAVIRHKLHRVRAEIDWHTELLAELPAIIADESARKNG